MATVDLKDAKKVYSSGVEAVKGVSIAIPDKELCVLVGPSGCGKSTLLRMIAGLETISSGTVAIDGKIVNAVGPAERDIAMVFQNYALYPHMKVYDNMAYGLRNRGTPKDEIDSRVRSTAKVLELSALLDRRPRELSGGQRQRVAMGRAIVRNPKVFLFDEPLSNLDAKLRGQMRVEIKNLQRTLGVTSIYVTHDQLEAMTLADILVVMNAGLVEQIGAPLDIYEAPASTFVASFIGAPPMNLLALTGGLSGPTLADGTAIGFAPADTKAATLGFRPEDADVTFNAKAPSGALVLPATVEAVEPVGAESFLHCAAGGVRIVMRVAGRAAARPGDQLRVVARAEKLHWFDKTGKRVG
ncbi:MULTISPECIES: sn-glycerol-3-phosphate import ATP-binding protein UgpC [unclassified Mesorhizobium]|uniref:sn-glycerol-3-phosphate import ATP-binding protein UgpC n=1 Tax=unclassified Mesorhizobium TaxID=325217 RepID=UPI000FD8DDFF|nr:MULTISPECIES: sn-glycerol-3-phosphate import ATP-binding protein UgpC [unclassified Mesorhizobium]TGQ45874.1 sn-glycerol-3-phosphate import ATP-binding protein UgpC [Mesorhizobium sp. M00.F.Ca.ET.216.01.1.1]TIS56430.1 MAG: sn-glycerol-3-phosphate ABC transporter ATP-binding protein UgpC [Mesorhizobium sp.]TIS91036.1 MAG: sn-glycerol-3-phosphate ABC transporter ATP-binding protein UgpC [Mesorhizobium sp.]TJW13032.1 MAG: sn-glycerol-3-phosphate ABC transporter ATP-binding protein UgpC [Mesorhi